MGHVKTAADVELSYTQPYKSITLHILQLPLHVYNLIGNLLTQTIWFSIKALEQ